MAQNLPWQEIGCGGDCERLEGQGNRWTGRDFAALITDDKPVECTLTKDDTARFLNWLDSAIEYVTLMSEKASDKPQRRPGNRGTAWSDEKQLRLDDLTGTGSGGFGCKYKTIHRRVALMCGQMAPDALGQLGPFPPVSEHMPAWPLVEALERVAASLDPKPPEDLSGCDKAIWCVLADAGVRMTTGEIITATSSYSNSYSKSRLADLVKRKVLTNQRQLGGYGLPHWPD